MRWQFDCAQYPSLTVRLSVGMVQFHGGRFGTDDDAIGEAMAAACERDTSMVCVTRPDAAAPAPEVRKPRAAAPRLV